MVSSSPAGLNASDDIDDPVVWIRCGVELLDSALGGLERGEIGASMDELVTGLRRLRDENAEFWREFIRTECLSHPIASILRQDPLTARSLLKPRGYAGDPVMLDFIFSPDRIPPGTSDIGAAIFAYTTDGPAPRSVRARATMMAGIIDEMSARKPLRVLAVMGGHLWEAGGLGFSIDDWRGTFDANRKSKIENLKSQIDLFLAFDQDARTLAAIEGMHGRAITTYQGTLRSLFRGRSVFRNFDLLYSPICDNLADPVASRCIATLFDALAPGGRMVLSNFAPELVDAGYMEAFMDWNLVYRNEKDLERIAESIPTERIAARTTYRDPHNNIAFLDITRL